jgi:hypothetical protein
MRSISCGNASTLPRETRKRLCNRGFCAQPPDAAITVGVKPGESCKLNLYSMHTVRRLLRSVAAAWVVCQLAGVVAAPLAMRFAPAPEPEHHATKCVCPGVAPGQTCPMHHTTRDNGRECLMRSASGPADAALLSLVGTAGLVPSLSSSLVTLQSLEPISAATPCAIARAARPDAPPPRG